MSAGAWWMLGITWAVVAAITGRLFWRVLTLPPRSGKDDRR